MNPNFKERELKVGGRVIIETLYNGISVYIDKETGYYSAAKICRDTGRSMRHLRENQDYQLTKEAISSCAGIPAHELERVFEGLPVEYRGTWIHPLLVHPVCEWANKKYAVQVSMLMIEKAKQAIIEKKTLQEQIDDERNRTQRSKDLLREKDKALKRAKHRCKDVIAELKAFRAEANARDQQAQVERQGLIERNDKLIVQNKKLIAQNKKQHEDIDTLHNMLFGVDAKVSDVQRTLHHREDDIKRLTKAAGFVVHEMKKQTIARTITNASNDITVLYRTAMKPASDDVRLQASDTQLWLGSYNGDKANYKPNKLPEDYDEVYYIESNRLNSFKYLLSHEDVAPFIIRSYQRSLLIEEENLEQFIEAVDRALNENNEFKSVISLENTKEYINNRKKETAELNKERNLKAHILSVYTTVHVIRNSFKRLVYCYILDDEGNEVLTPLSDVDKEYAIKHPWFYRYGTGGKYIQELTFASIEKSKFTKYGDARIRYEE